MTYDSRVDTQSEIPGAFITAPDGYRSNLNIQVLQDDLQQGLSTKSLREDFELEEWSGEIADEAISILLETDFFRYVSDMEAALNAIDGNCRHNKDTPCYENASVSHGSKQWCDGCIAGVTLDRDLMEQTRHLNPTPLEDIDSEDFKKQFGQQIKQTREAAGITQEVFANYIGLSRASIANIEAGRQSVTMETFVQILRVPGLNVDGLIPQVK